jgi:hypothetical protein|tara:strand:- start:255 stop:569 length:315 start_codon:yes stop_codon:yes gene_type:complete
MAITLGKNGTSAPFGSGIVSVSVTEEQELIDVTNRSNAGTGIGYKIQDTGFTSTVYEIECHGGASAAITEMLADTTSGLTVVGVTESASVDGVKTFTITVKDAG